MFWFPAVSDSSVDTWVNHLALAGARVAVLDDLSSSCRLNPGDSSSTDSAIEEFFESQRLTHRVEAGRCQSRMIEADAALGAPLGAKIDSSGDR
jgi:hypothetical protein